MIGGQGKTFDRSIRRKAKLLRRLFNLIIIGSILFARTLHMTLHGH